MSRFDTISKKHISILGRRNSLGFNAWWFTSSTAQGGGGSLKDRKLWMQFVFTMRTYWCNHFHNISSANWPDWLLFRHKAAFWLSGRKGGHMAFAVLWLRQKPIEWQSEPTDGPKGGWVEALCLSVSLSLTHSVTFSVCLSISPSVYLSNLI